MLDELGTAARMPKRPLPTAPAQEPEPSPRPVFTDFESELAWIARELGFDHILAEDLDL